ncbi:hypothetical protein BO70DRAFT_93196 [Aspergillus heteromorphus CBS 117.55]|uniref:Uncharacterized protein n=1 Tax=Aspergillus heteromorphus CBS 117.55 TaxID=1448321 RepID=A0A317VSH5_9EURO|nr:uncharacterized protein BO70DRAFT_93196 [Aspergillus heteromorphus CBS 117.55]PWY76261.1 hypothetical protein BO70DRAFT_93196 [Aspergillus heteromorphus CBS 117.55]
MVCLPALPACNISGDGPRLPAQPSPARASQTTTGPSSPTCSIPGTALRVSTYFPPSISILCDSIARDFPPAIDIGSNATADQDLLPPLPPESAASTSSTAAHIRFIPTGTPHAIPGLAGDHRSYHGGGHAQRDNPSLYLDVCSPSIGHRHRVPQVTQVTQQQSAKISQICIQDDIHDIIE